MIDEYPRIFFLHYWKMGNAQELARGFREALDQTGNMEMHKGGHEQYQALQAGPSLARLCRESAGPLTHGVIIRYK